MSNRENFTLATKRTLAERAGYRCSFPGCGAATMGPSDEAPNATANIGMACHIVAAATGSLSRRVEADMLPKQVRSIKNGIWMCYKHGKLIDSDEKRFTVEVLQHWRKIAERRAQLILDHGELCNLPERPFLEIGLAFNDIVLPANGLDNIVIGDALNDSCLPIVWGREMSHAVRDAIIEIARNALEHGGATTLSMSIDGISVRLSDNGGPFDPWSLFKDSYRTGGANAIQYLLSIFGHRLVAASRRTKTGNETILSLIHSPDRVLEVTSCTIDIRNDLSDLQQQVRIKRFESCNIIYVLLPKYFNPSGIMHLFVYLEPIVSQQYPIVFVAQEISENVREQLLEIFSGSKVAIL